MPPAAPAPSVPAAAPPELSRIATLPPGSVLHVVKRGDTMSLLVRMYLAQSSYLTASEFHSAVRAANGKASFRPGDQVIIPGIEAAPITEQPIAVEKDFEARAIYLTGIMAGSERGIGIIRRWREVGGNTVVFDVKDSDGLINIAFEHPLAPKTKHPPIRNLPKLVRFLHSQGMHAIARIAIFRDEHLAQQHSELAIHSRRTGQPWRESGKLVWADPSSAEVQRYNIALAMDAARAGVDEIQFDYVRFPAEGDQKDARFAYESEHPQWKRWDVISNFLARAYAQLHPLGVLFSLDVFGVMAWQRPVDLAHTGQDIVAMAKSCDVLSPMIYPSHFYGMDGYALPGDAPEHFIGASMDRFREITRGSGVVLRPWLQAFGWRTRSYSPEYIRTQVSVARKKGGIGFLFWNARNDYSKPFIAMPEMRSSPGRFFRGDELPASRPAARLVNTAAGAQ
jgi:hypothetical protein